MRESQTGESESLLRVMEKVSLKEEQSIDKIQLNVQVGESGCVCVCV